MILGKIFVNSASPPASTYQTANTGGVYVHLRVARTRPFAHVLFLKTFLWVFLNLAFCMSTTFIQSLILLACINIQRREFFTLEQRSVVNIYVSCVNERLKQNVRILLTTCCKRFSSSLQSTVKPFSERYLNPVVTVPVAQSMLGASRQI